MARIKNLSISLILILISTVIVLSILFYHVSAVINYDRDQKTRFMGMAQKIHTLTDCQWISDITIKARIITLKCESVTNGQRYLHFNTAYQIVNTLDPTLVHFDDARSAFQGLTGIKDFKITLTYFGADSVYWISSGTKEWLLSIKDYSILWKVDKSYD